MALDNPFLNRLREYGYPEHLLGGIGMNIADESSWDPRAEGDNGNAFGLAQWNGPRKRALFQFAAAQGKDPGDPVLQADFMHYENTHNPSEMKAYNNALAAPDAGTAGAIWVNQWERPAKEHAQSRTAKYTGGGGSSDVTMSSRGGGGPFGYMTGEDDEDFAIAQGLELPEPTWRDRLRAGLAASSEALGDLGAGHASDFRSTDAFLRGEEERRILRSGQKTTVQNAGQIMGWLAGLGPEYADLVDLVRSGGDPKTAQTEALKRKAAIDKAALEGGGIDSPLPKEVLPKLYETGQGLGTAFRGLTSLQALMDQMDEALEAGDTERFRALKEAAQGVEKDYTVGMGKYYSGGTEPSEAYFKGSGLGIPSDLVSEKELNEILADYEGDFPGMAVALLQKYPDLAPYLGAVVGAQAGGGGGIAGAVTGAAGAAGGAGAGQWLEGFLKEHGSAEAAKQFNKMRLDQARIRLANAGTRLQGEMTARQKEYLAATGKDFGITYGEGWDKERWGVAEGLDPSDPANWS